jgi:hypothetical protein
VILNRLGNKCRKCGFIDLRAIQIDHIFGGGNRARKKFSNARMYINSLYRMDLISLTENYQLLCANCNWIKRDENKELLAQKYF